VVLLRQAVKAGSVNRETDINIRSPPFRSTGSAGIGLCAEGVMHEQRRQL